MSNYISINGQKINLTAEQVEKIKGSFQLPAVKLADTAPGDIVKVGNHEFIVLEHVGAGTALIRKDLLRTGEEFGENNNYDESNVDEICNEFAEEIAGIVGEDNILLHEVDLTSDDGLKDYGKIQRKASLLTAERYRQYVAILDKHKINAWWWLATAFSTATHENDSWVKCVSPAGYIDSNDYGHDRRGVRPFCILKSSIFVSN